MTLEMAEKIARFCETNGISDAQVMGGEFFQHPEWERVIDVLVRPLTLCRLITNGDWAGKRTQAKHVLDFLKAHDTIRVGISRDKWHTNRHVDAAADQLKKARIQYRLPTAEEVDLDGTVPVGRADLTYGFFSTFGCYCHNPVKHYAFLIDEVGEVYKCGFGAWNYANVTDYVEGGFVKRFRDFNRVFYKQFIGSCQMCLSAWARAPSR